MRWFTDAAYDADDDEWDRILANYAAHLEAISPRLPPDLAALAREPRLNLHDARIREVSVDRDAREVGMVVVVVGDLQLTLEFRDAVIIPDNLQAVAYAVGAEFQTEHWGRTWTVIMAQEIEALAGGRFLLRLRLWPFHEFAIEFGAMSLDESTTTDLGDRPGRFRLATSA